MEKSVFLLSFALLVAGCASPSGPHSAQAGADDVIIVPQAAMTEDISPPPPEEDRRFQLAQSHGAVMLNDEALLVAFTGRVMRGCYPSGETFAEVLGEDGRFYDVLRNYAVLGSWHVDHNELCFAYPERAAAGKEDSCFVVLKAGNGYDFYTKDLGEKVASTKCQD